MSIRHHLDEATLISYAAGSLSQAMALVAACHISLCPECRERVRRCESMGGMLLDSLEEVGLSSEALDRVLGAIDAEPARPRAGRQSSVSVRREDVPAPLADYLDSALEDVKWKRIMPGFWYFDLPMTGKGVSRLLRIAPGKAVLPHTHEGNELTLVLKGSFSDEVGRFMPGDIADLDDQIEHQPLVDSEVDCVCLVATEGPLKFTTLLGRIVQPMTGF